MRKRKQQQQVAKPQTPAAPLPSDGWTVSESMTIHGRHVTKGTELGIAGHRGRYRFLRHVRTDTGCEWIDVIGGPNGHVRQWRSFRPDLVRVVHRDRRLLDDAELAAQHKAKRGER